MNKTMTDFEIIDDVDLLNTLDSGQSFAWERIYESEKTYFKGFFRDTELLVSRNKDKVIVKIIGGKKEDGIDYHFHKYLGDDPTTLSGFSDLLQDDVIKPVIDRYPKIRILKQEPWECIVGFITSSCSNLERIKYHMSLLRKINNDVFPDPESIFLLGENKLRELGFGFRAPYIINISKALIDGKFTIDELSKNSYLDSLELLTSIKGIGRKIADCILAYSFDKKESFPVDRHVLNGLVRWYKYPKKINPVKASDRARKKFGDMSSYAQQYIFHRQRLASRAQMWGGTHKEFAISSDIN